MYAIEEKRRVLEDGTEIVTYSRDIYNANVLEVEAGTTGYMGGDTGHGGRTYFRIKDAGSTDINARTITDKYRCSGFEVTLGGDCELETIIQALNLLPRSWRMEQTRYMADILNLRGTLKFLGTF